MHNLAMQSLVDHEARHSDGLRRSITVTSQRHHICSQRNTTLTSKEHHSNLIGNLIISIPIGKVHMQHLGAAIIASSNQQCLVLCAGMHCQSSDRLTCADTETYSVGLGRSLKGLLCMHCNQH